MSGTSLYLTHFKINKAQKENKKNHWHNRVFDKRSLKNDLIKFGSKFVQDYWSFMVCGDKFNVKRNVSPD